MSALVIAVALIAVAGIVVAFGLLFWAEAHEQTEPDQDEDL